MSESDIDKKYKQLIDGFDELEALFKTTQLVMLQFQTSILNEYRYCARAIIDFGKAESEKQKLDALARAEVALSAAYNDIIDYIVDGIKQAVNGLRQKYWDRPVKPILDKYGYSEVATALTYADELIIDTRKNRAERLNKYIDFSRSQQFGKIRDFALNFYSLNFELDAPDISAKERESILVQAMLKALAAKNVMLGQGTRFELYLQPKFRFAKDDASPAVVGAEALIRLFIDDGLGKRQMVAPDVFLKVGHEAGLTNRIGAWVVEEAISIAKGWKNSGLPQDFDLSINISPVQMALGGFATDFTERVIAAGVDDVVSVELIEEWGKDDGIYVSVANRLHELSARTRVHIDDFGSGSTKLSYISRTDHLYSIKIDRCLVLGLGSKGGDKAKKLIDGIVAFAMKNNLHIIAEGVENDEQLGILKGIGVEDFQGFHKKLFSAPIPQKDFEAKYLCKKGVEATL